MENSTSLMLSFKAKGAKAFFRISLNAFTLVGLIFLHDGLAYGISSEFEKIHSDLISIKIEIENTKNLQVGDGILVQNDIADSALESASKHFQDGFFALSADEARMAIALFQKISQTQAKKAYRILGLAQARLKRHDVSRQAFLEYLNIVLTTPEAENDFEEMAEVLRAWFLQSDFAGYTELQNMNKALSGLVEFVDKTKDQTLFYFYLGETAVRTKQFSAALDWFEKASALSSERFLEMRINYFRALVAYQTGNKDRAKLLLTKNYEETQKEWNGDRYEVLSTIALSRLVKAEGLYPEAQVYLSSIPDNHLLYFLGIRESIELAILQGNFSAALKKVTRALKVVHNSSHLVWLQTIQPFLLIKSGNGEEASQKLAQLDNNLTELSMWMGLSLDQFLDNSIEKLDTMAKEFSRKMAFQSQFATKLSSLNQSIMTNSKRLTSLEEDVVRDSFQFAQFYKGQEGIEPLRADQRRYYQGLSQRMAVLGQSFLLALNSENFSNPTVQTLVIEIANSLTGSGEEDRWKLINLENWGDWASVLRFQAEASSQQARLLRLKAELASGLYLQKVQQKTDKRYSAEKLLGTIENYISKLNRALFLISRKSLSIQVKASLMKQLEGRSTQMSEGLEKGFTLVKPVVFANVHKLTSKKIDETFKLWLLVQSELTRRVGDLARLEDKMFSNYLSWSQKSFRRIEELRSGLATLDKRTSQSLRSSIQFLRDDYAAQLGKSTDESHKWRADLEWLRVTKAAQDMKQNKDELKLLNTSRELRLKSIDAKGTQ